MKEPWRSAAWGLVPGGRGGEVWRLLEGLGGQPPGGPEAEEWVPTTCGFCGTGCGIYLGVRGGRAVAARGIPGHPVNDGKLCVKGSYQWKAIHHLDRATRPMLRQGGRLQAVSWEKALQVLAARLEEALAREGPPAVGVYTGAQLTLEEHYALGKLARGVLGTPNLDANVRLCMAAAAQAYVNVFGADGPPGCFEDLELADCLLVWGCNLPETYPQLWNRVLAAARKRGTRLVVVDPRATYAASRADLHLALRPGSNVALLNGMLHVILEEGLADLSYVARHTAGFTSLGDSVKYYTPGVVADLTGVSPRDLRVAARAFATAGAATTLFVQGVNQSVSATAAASLICTMHLVTGQLGRPGASPFSLSGQASSLSYREAGSGASLVGMRDFANPLHRRQVAELWGIRENVLPDHTNDITAMLDMIEEGRMEVLWVVASNPALSLPHQERARRLLDKVFLVVQDIYPTETAAYADLFLPAAGWGEKAGAYTNAERRVSLARAAVEPPGEARSDLRIFQDLASLLGAAELFNWPGPAEVFEEWRLLSRGRPCDMNGVSHQRLDREGGLQWPCPGEYHPGTPRLYTEGIFFTLPEKAQDRQVSDALGRALLRTAVYEEGPERPDGEYPFWLLTGRILEHYHGRSRTGRVPELRDSAPRAYLSLHPEDAAILKVREGERVQVGTRRGQLEVVARLNGDVPRGSVFLPFHFGGAVEGEAGARPANFLTGAWVDRESGQPALKVAACRVVRLKN